MDEDICNEQDFIKLIDQNQNCLLVIWLNDAFAVAFAVSSSGFPPFQSSFLHFIFISHNICTGAF